MSREWNEPPRYRVQIQLPPKEEADKPRVLTYACGDEAAAYAFVDRHIRYTAAIWSLYDNEAERFIHENVPDSIPYSGLETEGDI